MEIVKRLYTAFVAVLTAMAMWSCGPAEIGYTEEGNILGLFNIGKVDDITPRTTVALEFVDTFYVVRNAGIFDLEDGDRALLKVHYYYNAYSGQATQWDIEQVIKKIQVYPLSMGTEIDSAKYTTPVTALEPYYFYDEFKAYSWVWDGKQNIGVRFKGVEETAEYAMTVRGVKDGCVELDLWVAAEEAEKETQVLLTFDISNIADFIDPADKSVVPADIDSVKTKIYVRRMKNDALIDDGVDGNYVVFF